MPHRDLEQRRVYMREYDQRPGVIARRRERRRKNYQRPEVKAKAREYTQRPEVRERAAKRYREKIANDPEFRRRERARDRRRRKQCQERQNRLYRTDPEYKTKRKARDRERKDRNTAINHARIAEYFSNHSCMDCSETDILVLDFHHRDPAPGDIGVCRLASQGASLRCLDAEIVKCDVLCRNCHAKRHGKRGCDDTKLRETNANSWRAEYL